jgi:hypothetical protein
MCSESDCSINKIDSSLSAIIIIATASYYSIHFPQINSINLKLNPTKGEL